MKPQIDTKIMIDEDDFNVLLIYAMRNILLKDKNALTYLYDLFIKYDRHVKSEALALCLIELNRIPIRDTLTRDMKLLREYLEERIDLEYDYSF